MVSDVGLADQVCCHLDTVRRASVKRALVRKLVGSPLFMDDGRGLGYRPGDLASDEHVPGHPGQARQIASPAQAAALIDHLRSSGRTLTYDPQNRTLQADTEDAVTVAVG